MNFNQLLSYLKINKRYFIPLVFLLIIAVVVFIYSIILVFKITTPRTIEPNNALVYTDASKDYSKINSLQPGKSTLQNVKQINGEPDSSTISQNKTELFYKTPLNGYTNKVVLKNNKVEYANENVFGSYRGTVSDFINKHGTPDIVLYDKVSLYPWYIYLNKGVAIENDKTDILNILYFVPTYKNIFMANIAKEVGMLETPPDVE